MTPCPDSAADREAIVLRFFRGLSLRDTGVALGTTEEAARKRVSRAVDKLSGLFQRKGVTVPTAVDHGDAAAQSFQQHGRARSLRQQGYRRGHRIPAPGAAPCFMKVAAMSKTAVATLCIAAAAVPITWQAAKFPGSHRERFSNGRSRGESERQNGRDRPRARRWISLTVLQRPTETMLPAAVTATVIAGTAAAGRTARRPS